MLRYALLAGVFAFPTIAAGNTIIRIQDKLTPPASAIYHGVSIDEMAEIMSNAGYRDDIVVEGDKEPFIESKASGMTFWVYLYNCDGDPRKCRRIQFQSSFKTDKAMQDKALDWNNKKVAGRAANDKDKTYFDYLIDSGGGVTSDNLVQNLERFDTLMSEFTDYIGWR